MKLLKYGEESCSDMHRKVYSQKGSQCQAAFHHRCILSSHYSLLMAWKQCRRYGYYICIWHSKLENGVRIQKDLSKLKNCSVEIFAWHQICRKGTLRPIDNQRLNMSYQSHIVAKSVNIVLAHVNRNILYETHRKCLPHNFLKFFVQRRYSLSNISSVP